MAQGSGRLFAPGKPLRCDVPTAASARSSRDGHMVLCPCVARKVDCIGRCSEVLREPLLFYFLKGCIEDRLIGKLLSGEFTGPKEQVTMDWGTERKGRERRSRR